MKISIITVVYNAQDTIRDCIESVISQTYNDIEYIIIDGSSDDGTQHIIEEYVAKGGVAQYISEKDGGIYDAMNKGIACATGEMVGLLNADDLYNNSKVVETVVAAFVQHDTDCVYGDLLYVAKNNTDKVTRYWKSRPYTKGLCRTGWHPPHPTLFVKMKMYTLYGTFNTRLRTAADYELMIRFFEKHAVTSRYIPAIFVKMRVGGASNHTPLAFIRGNRQSIQAWKINGLIPPRFLFFIKPLRKAHQWILKKYE